MPLTLEHDRPAAATAAEAPREYVYAHDVCFRETNVVGNVYFANFLEWQGRCREMFLRDHAPDLLRRIEDGLRLVTLSVGAEFFEELHAFDRVEVRMSLAHRRGNRVAVRFGYWRVGDGAPRLVARGTQEIGIMQAGTGGLTPVPVPDSLADALELYS
ncbi:acyl-CoA thioesterase [Salinarimonas sp.]|uniref:acyl-CoA thioesterase n=1 Tax=Salinarimonas sp. TaxID=2766526 RepID=UPI0032D92E4E